MVSQEWSGKRVLLGVTGGIAVYKAVDLLRKLTERGAEVHVVMTKNAERFVPRLTFEVLSRRPVLVDEFNDYNKAPIGHIEFTDNIDLAVVAPATANVIGKITAGIADDGLTSALMAVSCPLLLAPAMNERMYRNPILQRNIETLMKLGVRFVEPGTGILACGTSGKGRLADIELIVEAVRGMLAQRDLVGKTLLITAGPTREPIDAVRFISNPSTGKMGFALAAAARDRGAHVILISGPTEITAPPNVEFIRVITAQEMHNAVMASVEKSHAVIMSAAVSDFRPATSSERKIKKDEAETALKLERTEDILLKLGKSKGSRVLVGFAAETEDLERNALQKLRNKNLDLIVANDVLKTGAGFATDTNIVSIYDSTGKKNELPMTAKSGVAAEIISMVAALLK